MPERTAPLYRNAAIYFSLVFLVAMIGFFPSFFSRLRETNATHHFHGFTATAWMLLLITQGWLVRQGNFSSHRTFGKLSFVIAPLFIASGFLMIHTMLASTNEFSRTFGARLAFVDITTITYFSIAYGLAIRYRRTLQLHARYMASTAILVLPPALSRAIGNLVPGIGSFEAAFHWGFVISELIVVALILHDAKSGKLRPPYLILLGLLLVQQAGFLVIPNTAWWNDVCAWIGSM